MISGSFNFVEQAVESFRDGAQFSDAPAFFDEFTYLPKMIGGVAAAWVNESLQAAEDPEKLDALYAEQRQKLIRSGLRPALAATIESGVKTLHFAVVSSIESSRKGSVID